MPLKTTSKYIRICDLCGKEEGKHLKSSDFFEKPRSINIRNFGGKFLTFSLDITATDADYDTSFDDTLNDVLRSYKSQKVSPESLVVVNMKKPFQDSTILCKKCYNTLVDMISKNGTFDKPENF